MEEDGSITFFREFASVIAILQEKTTVVIEVDEQISGLLEELASCPYENDVLTRIMSTLQQIVGLISRHSKHFDALTSELPLLICLDHYRLIG